MASHFSMIGNYRLVKELASGAYGRVYRGEHIYLADRVVAVKVLHTHLSSEKERQSFLHEAQILSMLQHPHILPVLDVGINGGVAYMITEFAHGGSLRDRIQANPHQLIPLNESIRIVSQVAQALQLAHQRQIVHRDLKPENILFHANGDALLADFGISTVLSSMSVKMATVTGTPAYMAPEQFQGTVSKESDQYALGCLAYRLFTGQLPFAAHDFFSMAMKHMHEMPLTPTFLNPQLPEHISQAILKTIAKERHLRYADVMDFVSAIRVEPPRSVRPTSATAPQPVLSRTAPQVALAHKEYLNTPTQNLDPRNAALALERGNRHYSVQQYGEALAAYDEAIQLHPQNATAYRCKGNALRFLRRYDEALVAYECSLQLNPMDDTTHYNKGMILRSLQRFDETLAAYNQALRLNPKNTFAQQDKALLLKHLNRQK